MVFFQLLTSCKKGENDPFISLRTRKDRVTGDWRLTSGSATLKVIQYKDPFIFLFSSSWVKLLLPQIKGNPVVDTEMYDFSLHIRKNGRFFLMENLAGTVFEAEGSWNFNTGTGADKKKECLHFMIDSVIAGGTGGPHHFNRFSPGFTYTIKELRNKKLVLRSTGIVYAEPSGKTENLTCEYVLEQ